MKKFTLVDISVHASNRRRTLYSQNNQRIRPCQWHRCNDAGTHRAPVSHDRMCEYYWFCKEHIQCYHDEWAQVLSKEGFSHANSDNVWERPTWSRNASTCGKTKFISSLMNDDGEFWRREGYQSLSEMLLLTGKTSLIKSRRKAGREKHNTRKRWSSLLEKRSLSILGLPQTATDSDIQMRYQHLLKEYHPDTNNGDRKYEDKLKQVIMAWKILKLSSKNNR